jgi:hypothetical protein
VTHKSFIYNSYTTIFDCPPEQRNALNPGTTWHQNATVRGRYFTAITRVQVSPRTLPNGKVNLLKGSLFGDPIDITFVTTKVVQISS